MVDTGAYLNPLLLLNLALELILQLICLLLLGSNFLGLHVGFIAPEVHLQHIKPGTGRPPYLSWECGVSNHSSAF